MSGIRLSDIPLRVCYYARVSTDSSDQLNSLDNQLLFYEDYIKSNNKWDFVGGYIEEGISGVSVNKRESFKRMIMDAKLGKMDLIITKEASRFARDLEDSIHYIRELKKYNVGVLFVNQNLNTFDCNSELVLNIMFNLAQEESKKLSERIKFGHRQSILKGHVLGSSNITGYKKEKCRLVIDPKEASFIRVLYELYSTGEYGLYKLSRKLGDLGYYNKHGNYYDKDTLKKMIENPKYKGYLRSGVYEVVDYRTKKRKKNDVENQIIKKVDEDIIPPIVSEELWNKANEILLERTNKYNYSNYSGGLKYPFSSKMICSCKSSFQHSHGSKYKIKSVWSCRRSGCKSPIILEDDLYNIFSSIIKRVVDKNIIIDELLKIYNDVDINNDLDKKVSNINSLIIDLDNKKRKILDLVIDNIITSDEYKKYNLEYEEEINKLNIEKDELLLKRNNISFKHNLISYINDVIDNELIDSFIRKFVDKIFISKINNNRRNINLDIYIDLYNESNYKLFIENDLTYSLENRRGIINSFNTFVFIK